MRLYIIRHGETVWNTEKRLQGWKNSPLTEKGIVAAEKLRNRLEYEGISFDKVYTSTQERALETAKIITKNQDVEIKQLDDLKELNYGTWEGMRLEDIKEQYEKEYNIYLKKTHLYKPLGDGESFDEIFERVERALNTIIQGGGNNILVVAHGVTIKVLTAIIKNIKLNEFYTLPIHRGTALNICEVDEFGRKEFILEGDISHIEGDE